MHSINITEAEKNDLHTILELQKLCYHENALRYNNLQIPPLQQTLSDIEEDFKRLLFLKAVTLGAIVGSVRAHEKETTCFITRLFVHPKHQNCGIGKKLLAGIEERFKHLRRFELYTGYKDIKNIALYQKLGFSTFRKEERPHDGMLFYFMEKVLT